MRECKKTFLKTKNCKNKKKSQNKNLFLANNINMKEKEKNCNLFVMQPNITEQDLSSLFNGILNVVKKKFELDNKAEIININSNMEILMRKLKEKEAECIRLKNEILHLKNELSKN